MDQAELISEATVIMKDTKFTTAREKRKVLRQWTLFLTHGLSRHYFAKSLYEHLTQHCAFIAHYDINGFYDTYFEEPEDSIKFLSQFDNRDGTPMSIEYGWIADWYHEEGYHDINAEMCRIARKYIPDLVKKCETDQEDKDITRAKLLMAKHGIYILKAKD